MSQWGRCGQGAVMIVLGIALAFRTLAGGTNAPVFRPKLPDESLWPQGRYVYQRNCLMCHGAFGDGRGEMGRDIQPQPRNFGRGLFKYRSTPAGSLPTDADLENTVRGGVAGTAMPVFNNLSDREIKSVIEYVKGFSPRWSKPAHYAPALVLPPLPVWFGDSSLLKARAEKGRVLYDTACAVCHGSDGGGSGVAAKNLMDSWGQPTTPSDLRQTVLRNGPRLETIFRVLLTGIDGTPMPAFAETMTEEERWELVAFIVELRRNRSGGNAP